MRELKLKAAPRFLIISMLNDAGKAGGSLQQLKDMMKIIEKVELTEEERKEIELTSDAEAGKVMWKPEKDEVKSIELSDDQADLIKELLKKKNEAKEFTFDTLIPFNEVAEQLDVK